MSITRASIAAVGAAILMSLPAAGEDDAPARTRPVALEGSTLTWCGDVEPIRAAPGAYRDRPVYVGNEQPTEQLEAWARQQPGYEDLWIDRENLGWVTLQFSQDAAARQADLESLFPDAGAVAVAVENRSVDLRRLSRRAVRELQRSVGLSFGVSEDTMRNLVEVGVPYLTRLVVTKLERRLGRAPVCVDGGDPADRPVPGPQPTDGDGWQLLGHRQGQGPTFRTGVAADERAYGRLWEQADLPGRPPAVDFVDHIVVWFAEPHGSSCPERRLDDVIVDRDAAVVYPLLVDPEANMACTSDLAGAWQFLVALERSRLPAGPFHVQLGPADPPGGAPGERTVVDVDLSIPGSAAGPGEIHIDPTIGEPQPERSGTTLEPAPFGVSEYAFDVRCGVGYLGELNGIDWVSDVIDVPAAWQRAVSDDGELVVRVAIVEGPDPHVTATLNGETLRYDGVRQAPPACEG